MFRSKVGQFLEYLAILSTLATFSVEKTFLALKM